MMSHTALYERAEQLLTPAIDISLPLGYDGDMSTEAWPYATPAQRTPMGSLVEAARNVRRASPRVRMAARLYASGAAPTKRAAAKAVGISPEWFTTLTNHNDQTRRIVDGVDQQIEDQTVEMSTVLRTVGREAIQRIRTLMRGAVREDVQLKAAIDLADRNPETSKIQRHELTAVHIGPEEAKELASALVMGAKVRQRFADDVKGDFVRVDSDAPKSRQLASPAADQASQSSAAASEKPAEVNNQTAEQAERA